MWIKIQQKWINLYRVKSIHIDFDRNKIQLWNNEAYTEIYIANFEDYREAVKRLEVILKDII